MAYMLSIRDGMASAVIEPDGYDNVAALRYDYERSFDRRKEQPTPLPEHLIFRDLQLRRTRGKNGPGLLVGLGVGVGGGCWGIREDFKDAIEAVEPGIHEFFPLDVTTRGGKPLPQKYYLLNIMQCFDAIVIAESNVRWEWIPAIREIYGDRMQLVLRWAWEPDDLAFSRPKMAGRHLWTGANLAEKMVFGSDAMLESLRERGLARFFRHTHIRETDTVWDREENIGAYMANCDELRAIADAYNAR